MDYRHQSRFPPIHLPPISTFQVSDYVLLTRILKPKMCGEELPLNIPTLDVYSHHPSQLFDGVHLNRANNFVAGRYFFTHRKKISNNNSGGRNYARKVEGFGNWEGNNYNKICDHEKNIIGYDKYFDFTEANEDNRISVGDGGEVRFKMHEYSFDPILFNEYKEENKELVVCKIIMKVVKVASEGKKEPLVKRARKQISKKVSKRVSRKKQATVDQADQHTAVSEDLWVMWSRLIYGGGGDDNVASNEIMKVFGVQDLPTMVHEQDRVVLRGVHESAKLCYVEKQLKEEQAAEGVSNNNDTRRCNSTVKFGCSDNVKGIGDEGLKILDASETKPNECRTLDHVLVDEDFFPFEESLASLQTEFDDWISNF